MSVDGSLWYVKLADGDVAHFTLDQLDEAFQNGQIDESSMVLASGSDTWMKLADLLGGAADAPPEEATPRAPAPVAPAAAPLPPVAAPPVMAAVAPAPIARTTAPPAAPMAAPPMAVPAAATRPAPGPMAMPVPASAASVPVASSLRPFSVDVSGSLGADETPFRPSSKKRWAVGALVTVLAGGAGAFFVVKQTSATASSDPVPVFTAAAAAQPPPAPVTPPDPPAPAAAPSPPGAMTGTSSIMDPTKQRFTDEQREKLLEADKKKPHRAKSHGSWHAPKEKSTSSFTNSGNKYDPLNSSL